MMRLYSSRSRLYGVQRRAAIAGGMNAGASTLRAICALVGCSENFSHIGTVFAHIFSPRSFRGLTWLNCEIVTGMGMFYPALLCVDHNSMLIEAIMASGV